MQAKTGTAPFPSEWDPAWIDQRDQLERRQHDRIRSNPVVDGVHLALHYRFLRWMLKTARLYQAGYRNYLDLQLTQITHPIAGWPAPLDGLRILQISDLHIDLDPGLLPVILGKLNGIECDMVVFTGDFGEGAQEDEVTVTDRTGEILKVLGRPSFGCHAVLGNHDSLPLALALHSIGLNLLINDAVVLGSGTSAFALAGVDDAFFYRTADLNKAADRCPRALPRILLSHSPQLSRPAFEHDFRFMLSGHTHGGQICLPGGRAFLPMENIPNRVFRGLWKEGLMAGYTTTGTGSSHLPVRFNCPPEMVLHILRVGG